MTKLTSKLTAAVTVLAVIAVSTAPGAYAAPQRRRSSTLAGVVLGPNDKPVARAAITYQSSAGSAPHVVRTDAYGRFSVSRLPSDNYDLRASANGIFSIWEKNVTIRAGETRNVTLRLIYSKQMPKPGAITPGSVK